MADPRMACTAVRVLKRVTNFVSDFIRVHKSSLDKRMMDDLRNFRDEMEDEYSPCYVAVRRVTAEPQEIRTISQFMKARSASPSLPSLSSESEVVYPPLKSDEPPPVSQPSSPQHAATKRD